MASSHVLTVIHLMPKLPLNTTLRGGPLTHLTSVSQSIKLTVKIDHYAHTELHTRNNKYGLQLRRVEEMVDDIIQILNHFVIGKILVIFIFNDGIYLGV